MTLNGVMALFCVISANSGSFRAHCISSPDEFLFYFSAWFHHKIKQRSFME